MHNFCATFCQAFTTIRHHQPGLLFLTRFRQPATDPMRNKFTSREKKQLPDIGFFLLVLLVLWLVFAPNRGIWALYRSQTEIERLQEENSRLAEENKALQEEINRLQDDPSYLEEKARREYGMLKENELLYLFKKKEK
jgi:cell division protein FtsB